MNAKYRHILVGGLIISGILLVVFLLLYARTNTSSSVTTSAFTPTAPVGFLLSQDNPTSEDGLEGTFSIRTGTWDLNTGTFQYEEHPVLETTGPERDSQLFHWNGTDQYIVGDQKTVTAASDNTQLTSWVSLYDDSRVCWGPGYRLLVSLDDPAQITLEREDTDPVTVTATSGSPRRAAASCSRPETTPSMSA